MVGKIDKDVTRFVVGPLLDDESCAHRVNAGCGTEVPIGPEW